MVMGGRLFDFLKLLAVLFDLLSSGDTRNYSSVHRGTEAHGVLES